MNKEIFTPVREISANSNSLFDYIPDHLLLYGILPQIKSQEGFQLFWDSLSDDLRKRIYPFYGEESRFISTLVCWDEIGLLPPPDLVFQSLCILNLNRQYRKIFRMIDELDRLSGPGCKYHQRLIRKYSSTKIPILYVLLAPIPELLEQFRSLDDVEEYLTQNKARLYSNNLYDSVRITLTATVLTRFSDGPRNDYFIPLSELFRERLRKYGGGYVNLREGKLIVQSMSNVNLMGAAMQGADLSSTSAYDSCFRYADLRDIWGLDTVFSSDLSWADLTGSDINGGRYQDCIMHHAKLDETYLVWKRFINTDLSFASFVGANIKGVQFIEGTNLTRANLQQVKYTSEKTPRSQIRTIHDVAEQTIFQNIDITGAVMDLPLLYYISTFSGVVRNGRY